MPAEALRREVLTSVKNPLLKNIRRAIARGESTAGGCVIAEGFHLLEEAIRSERPVEAVLVASSVRSAIDDHIHGLKSVRVIELPDAVFNEMAATEASQGVLALVRPPAWSSGDLFRAQAMLVVLDGIQDPGNAGSIVRAAEAFGASGVMFLKGTANPHNPKALRASAGSLFRVPYLAGLEPEPARSAIEDNRLDFYAAQPRAGLTLAGVDLRRPFALLVGNEGQGVSERMGAGARGLRIPTAGVESLNVALAAGIVLYEASRQRMAAR